MAAFTLPMPHCIITTVFAPLVPVTNVKPCSDVSLTSCRSDLMRMNSLSIAITIPIFIVDDRICFRLQIYHNLFVRRSLPRFF